MIYTVYCIKIEGIIRYIGRTNNIKRREKEHNRDFTKAKKKLLYQNIFNLVIMKSDKPFEGIKLEPLTTYKTKIEAKRMEMYLILYYYFTDKDQLWQKVPNISDR